MAEKKAKQYVINNAKLMAEWNWDKNTDVSPSQVTLGSGKKVWWRCPKGHEWQAVVYNRNNGIGCPVCKSERNTSFPEYAIVYYLKKHGLEIIHSYKLHGYELDVYIPSKRIAIEFDGFYWHGNKTEKDIEKNRKCEKDGIKLFRIREGLQPLNDTSLDYVIQKRHDDLSTVLVQIFYEIIGCVVDVDLDRDAIDIENLRELTEKEISILVTNPDIAHEWNHEKNGKLRPENFSSNSGKKVWWKCTKGHEWQATIDSRQKGHGCPYCMGLYVIKGENDLQTVNPSLANEWNYEKNPGLTPMDVMVSAKRKVWWRCKNGHEWEAAIYSRNSGTGCPYCAGNKVIHGINDLQTLNPDLASQWNYPKNEGLSPADVMPNSIQKVWWKCSKGHEWSAVIESRNKGSGCPYCAGWRVIKGETDLQSVNPSLAKEWDYEKNDGQTPMDVCPNSHKKAWWKCSKGHEWQTTIATRNKGNGCPYCANQKVLISYNDLLSTNPDLATEWNYDKNGSFRPENCSATSHRIVWWKCKKGHEWQAEIRSRNLGRGCPYCSGRCAIKGENDLMTVNPILASEWDYEMNNGLTPMDVLPNSNHKVWWKCNKGHEWQATVNHRNHGSNCPYCSGRKVLTGYNDLQTVNPALAQEWNHEKNSELTPTDVTANCGKKVWWRCSEGHEWEATIDARNRGTNCPICAKTKRKKP